MLVVLTAWRVVAYPQRVLEDLHVPARAFGFFTGVAGTNVVAVCLIALRETVPVTCSPGGGVDCYETLRGGERRQCQRPRGGTSAVAPGDVSADNSEDVRAGKPAPRERGPHPRRARRLRSCP